MLKVQIKIFLFMSAAGFYITALSPSAAAEWVACLNGQVWVDQPLITAHDYDVHYASGGYLVFQDSVSQVVRYCMLIGPGWVVDGFRSVDAAPDTDQQTTVFILNRDWETRSFDMRDGKEVYLHQMDGRLFITDQPEEKPGQKVHILKNSWFDHVSGVSAAEYHRITRRADWYALWKRHRERGDAVPHVDFDSDMVIAIFAGERNSVDGVRLAEIREDNQSIYLYYKLAGIAQEESRKNDQPCSFYVLPRSSKKIVVFEGVPSEIGGPIQWLPVWER
jgi:hypothetical protein